MRRVSWREVVSMRRLRVVLGAAAVFVILAVPAGASGPGWSRVPTPNPLAPTGQLFGVSCPSEGTCIAVGSSVDASGTGVSLAERWDGTSWSRLSTPNPPGAATSALVSVSCTSSSACVAVGAYVDGSGARHVLAEGWDGSAWSLQSVPEPPGSQGAIFNAVSCSSASNCTAVGGYTGSSGVPVTLAEHWDGTAWTVQPTPNPSGASQFSTLSGIDCTSSSDCVAVGGSDQGALAEHWDGTSWSIQATPSPGQFAVLLSVSCVSSVCEAVGGYVNSSGDQVALAEHWDGTTWTVQPTQSPTGSQFALLVNVSCSSSSACTAVGTSSPSSFPFDGNAFSTLAERWDGQNWSLQTTANAPRGGALNGIACPQDSSCIAIGLGFDASGTVITLGQGWDGNHWSSQPTVSPQGARGATLAGVSCKSSSSCVAVGYALLPHGNPQGTLAEIWNGTAWRIVPTPNPVGAAGSGLNGVSCTSPSACVAVGTAFDSSGNSVGTLTERWNGTSWSIQPTPTSSSPGAFLNAVSCTSPNACTAVGNNGGGQVMAERWDGTSWRIEPVPAPGAPNSFLTGVSCTSATACTAVGAAFADSSFSNSLGTLAEQWNGTSWTLEPSPSSQSANYFLGAVSCTSASACTAVGNTDSGLLAERWNGTAWTLQSPVTPPGTEGTGDFFNGVSCSSPSACTAVGLLSTNPGPPSTVAERWDGTRWTVQPTPNLPGAYDIDPPAVSCPTRSACTAVGSFTNNLPIVTNAGPKVTLAEQWNGNGPATVAAGNSLAARSTRPSPCARALAAVSARPISTWFRSRPSIRTARASSPKIKTLIECRGA